MRQLLPAALLALAALAASAEDAACLLTRVRAYADAMIAHGRDRYGQPSPLFAACLDRRTLALPEGEVLAAIAAIPRETWGVRRHDRSLEGANPQHDQELYHLLHALDRLDRGQRSAEAEAALGWFFAHCQSPATGLMAWGEHLGWDFRREARIRQDHAEDGTHEFFGNWELWERSWALQPAAATAFAEGLWQHQISDHDRADFSRHAKYDRHAPGRDSHYPRHAGFYVATWAAAARHGDRAVWSARIGRFLAGLEARRHPVTRGLLAETAPRSRGNTVWAMSELSLAIDLHATAAAVDTAVAERLRACAATTDAVVLALPHRAQDGIFVTHAYRDTLAPGNVLRPGLPAETSAFNAAYGEINAAMAGLLCLERAAQGGDARLRELGLAAARCYLRARPGDDAVLWPLPVAAAITLELRAWRLTRDAAFLAAARDLAELACARFLPAGSPLPRATDRHDHYEAITGGPTLMLALLDLHWALARPDEDPRLPWCRR